jgi:dTMP kinase
VNRGLLFAFDGVDGAGKTTQAELLTSRLRSRGLEVVATKEPTQGPFGQRIKEQVARGEPALVQDEILWFNEDRRQHVSEVIEPALASGKAVVCDRYFLSTVAYQGARGVDPLSILADCEAKFPLPDLAIILDLDAEEGLARVHKRGNGFDPVFERLDRLNAASDIFRSLKRSYILRIDGKPTVERVQAEIIQGVNQRFGLEL